MSRDGWIGLYSEGGMENRPEVTPYRVSTITCNGTVSTQINIEALFAKVRIASDGFVWAQLGGKDERGEPLRRRQIIPIEPKPRKYFDNQVTLVCRLGERYAPNTKLFRNGNIQMTGAKTVEDASHVIDKIIEEIRHIYTEQIGLGTDEALIVGDPAMLQNGGLIIRMINTDFGVDYTIRRKDLHQLMISADYNILSSFQPGTYPGVKIQYFWNAMNRGMPGQGRCSCGRPCFGKGTGDGDGECKKVTIAVFESGKTLITGANTFEQVDDSYTFIRKVLEKENARLRKVLPTTTAAASAATSGT